MTMKRRTVAADLQMVGEDEVLIRMSTGQRARDGHILEPMGCVLDNYRTNPIQLWQHDPNEPVGCNADITPSADCITARTTFAPIGISPMADKVRGLVKSGVVRSVSIGFEVIDAVPIDPKQPRGGLRVSKWELLECSFVSVPADTGAVVTARSVADADWKVGAAKGLAIEDSDDWDGSAAEVSIFEHAGGEDFDPAQARKGFLVYNATEPKLRGSYKLPIAHEVDGALKVPKGAIRAAASRLAQTDIPEDVKTAAGKVLDHYKEKAGMTEDEARAFAAKRTRFLVDRPRAVRDLYDVAGLAHMLMHLGWLHGSAVWEAEMEADDSKVPAMLGEALKGLGETLVAMTTEEVNELLTGKGLDAVPPVEDVVLVEERAHVARGKTPAIRAWRIAGAAMLQRAGKALSQANAEKIGQASGHLDLAGSRAEEAAGHQAKAAEHGEALSDSHAKAATAHDKMAAAIEAANGSAPEDVTKALAKVQQAHKQVGKHLDAIGDRAAAIGDVQADAQGAIAGAQRCVRAASRCVRAVQDDTDVTDVQTSDGDGESDGTANDRALSHDARQRRAAALRRRAA
jgi:HK97 family phage prohead protease